MRSLKFHRSIAKSLITLSKQAKVGRPLSTLEQSHGSSKKCREVSYSVPDSIKLQNIGLHYAIYKSEGGQSKVFSKRSIQSRTHSKCYMFNVFLCCNEKKKCLKEFQNL